MGEALGVALHQFSIVEVIAGIHDDTSGQQPFERTYITGHRWWTHDEMQASRDRISPAGLPGLVQKLLADGVPAVPVRLPWRG